MALDRRPVIDLDERLQRAVRGFARDLRKNIRDGAGLWFEGESCTGKTSAAIAIARAALEQGYTVGFHVVPELLSFIRASFSDDAPEDYLALSDKLAALDLLILDDLGTEQQTPWVLEQLYVLVNRRLLDKRSIIVTTALKRPELEAQVTSRVVSRIERACGTPLLFKGFQVSSETAAAA